MEIGIGKTEGFEHGGNVWRLGDGKFHAEGLPDGEYDLTIDMDSVPPGYSLTALETQRTNVDAAVPAQMAFTLKAIRNVSGRVTIYDLASRQDVPVSGVIVLLQGLSGASVTDENGVYLFRDLPAGSYRVSVDYKGQEFQRDAVLPDSPAFPKDIDIALGAK